MVDTAGATSNSTLTVTIHGQNDKPVAVVDVNDANEAGVAQGSNATGNVLANDTDVDAGDGKTVVAADTGVRVGSYGTLTLNADGSYTYVIDNADPAVDALRLSTDTLTDQFTYTVVDTAGATSNSTLTVTIHGQNDAPVAVVDVNDANEAGVAPGSNATGNVLANDTDVDAGDGKTVVAADTGVRVGSYGTLTLNADGSYTYVIDNADPAVDALRLSTDTLTDQFTYTVVDTAGATSNSTLTVTIHGQNDEPVAVVDVNDANEAGVAPGSNATGNVLANDTDVDAGDGKTVVAADTGVRVGSYGTLTLNADGSYTYVIDNADPAVDALRLSTDTLTDQFTYTVVDTAGATSNSTLTVTIHGQNDTPVAVVDVNDANEAGVAPGSNATGNVLANDTDVDAGDGKTVVAADTGVRVGSYGTLTLNADGSYTYVIDNADPAVDALRLSTDTLTDQFTYTVVDTAGATSNSTLTVTIHGQNDAPVAVVDVNDANEAGVAPGSNATGNVLANDTDVDAGDGKTVVAADTGVRVGSYGTLTLNADGSYTYVIDNADPAVDALRLSTDTLTDQFTYTVVDTAGATSNSTLTVTIHGQNDAPVAVVDVNDANEAGVAPGSNATGNVLANDTDVDAGDGKTVVAADTGVRVGSYGTLTLNADGSYTYVIDNADPAVDALRLSTDTLTDQFTYTVVDTAGATSNSTLTVTIHGQNDAPVAVVDVNDANEAGVAPGSNATGNVLANDTDVDAGDGKTVVAADTGVRVGSYGTLTLNADGSYTYVIDNADPAVDALRLSTDTLTDQFTYTVVDTAGATSNSTLTVTIHGQNDAPVAVVDVNDANEAGVAPGSNATGNVLANDTDVDAGDGKTVVAADTGVRVGSYGTLTLNADGSYTYVIDNADPAVDALRLSTDTLTDQFTYTVVDTAGATSNSTLTVTIHGQNDAPVISNLSVTGTAIRFVATDPDNATLALSSPLATAFGNPVINSGPTTTLTATEQVTESSGTLQLTDGMATANVIGLYLGTSVANTATAWLPAASNAMYGFGGNDTLTGGSADDVLVGGAGADSLTGGAGNDIYSYATTAEVTGDNIVEAANGGTDTIRTTATANLSALNGSADLQGAGASQGIERILIQSGTTATFSGAQLTGNTIAVNESAAGTTNLVINVASGSTTTFAGLTFAAFSGGDAFDDGVDTITINGANGSDNITGTSVADVINGGGGGGDDTITGGAGADSLTGGNGHDTFVINAGDSLAAVAGSGNSGTIAGYDVIADFTSTTGNSDILNLQGTPAAATGTNVDGLNSTLTIANATVKSHTITNGIITFDDADSFGTALSLNATDTSRVAAAMQYLQNNDIDPTNLGTRTVAFVATINGTAHTYVYEQVGTAQNNANDILVDLQGITLTNLTGVNLAPAGVSGEAINLGLVNPADYAGDIIVTASGIPTGWTLSAGIDNGDGTWSVRQTTSPRCPSQHLRPTSEQSRCRCRYSGPTATAAPEWP